jgi:hypothetical protein
LLLVHQLLQLLRCELHRLACHRRTSLNGLHRGNLVSNRLSTCLRRLGRGGLLHWSRCASCGTLLRGGSSNGDHLRLARRGTHHRLRTLRLEHDAAGQRLCLQRDGGQGASSHGSRIGLCLDYVGARRRNLPRQHSGRRRLRSRGYSGEWAGYVADSVLEHRGGSPELRMSSNPSSNR